LYDNPLDMIMNPRSIATVGAGNNPLKMGTIQALSIVKDGYKGSFYPIHPREKKIFGYTAYPSVFELPETPELAIIILPAPLVPQIIEDFGKIGTRRAIIITAGFRETGEHGLKLERELMEAARRYDLRFLGPNCIGIINSEISLNVTMFPHNAKPGYLGMASQSGTYVTQTLHYLQERGIRFSKAISIGNEADIDIIDAIEYLGADEQTKAIALYIEGIKNGKRFLETVRKITPHKPIIAQYVGGSEAGARAGSSHTGAMAGPDYLYDGLFRQGGIIQVDSIEDVYYQGWVLATQPVLKGKRIAVLTNSGGPGTAIAHTCNRGGLEIPRLSEKLQSEVKKIIPAHGSSVNPVDITFHLDAKTIGRKLPDLLMSSGEIDGLIIHGLMGSGFMKTLFPHLNELFGLASEDELINLFKSDLSEAFPDVENYDIPVVLSSFYGREDNYTEVCQDNNLPVLDGPEKAARCMLALYKYKKICERPAYYKPLLPSCAKDALSLIKKALSEGKTALDEYTAKKLLAAYGIPVSKDLLAHSVEEAQIMAERLGYPVALKGCSDQFLHKSEHGLIHLGLEDSDAVSKAYHEINIAAGNTIPVIVTKMVSGKREFMAGLIRQPGFGPCVMFGLGGIAAEALKDHVFRLTPVTAEDASDMFSEIKSTELLGSFRHMPAVNLEAMAALLAQVGNIGMLHPEIAEIDLNPIIISESEPVVVDALVILDAEAK